MRMAVASCPVEWMGHGGVVDRMIGGININKSTLHAFASRAECWRMISTTKFSSMLRCTLSCIMEVIVQKQA